MGRLKGVVRRARKARALVVESAGLALVSLGVAEMSQALGLVVAGAALVFVAQGLEHGE